VVCIVWILKFFEQYFRFFEFLFRHENLHMPQSIDCGWKGVLADCLLEQFDRNSFGLQETLEYICLDAAINIRQFFPFHFIHYNLQKTMNKTVKSVLTINWRTPMAVGFQPMAGCVMPHTVSSHCSK